MEQPFMHFSFSHPSAVHTHFLGAVWQCHICTEFLGRDKRRSTWWFITFVPIKFKLMEVLREFPHLKILGSIVFARNVIQNVQIEIQYLIRDFSRTIVGHPTSIVYSWVVLKRLEIVTFFVSLPQSQKIVILLLQSGRLLLQFVVFA